MNRRETWLVRLFLSLSIAAVVWPPTARAYTDPVYIDVTIPNEVRPGQEFQILVLALNNGETAMKWSISVSFPDRPPVSINSPIIPNSSSAYARVIQPGEDVYSFKLDKAIPALYTLAEVYMEEPWPTGQQRYLTMRVTASLYNPSLRVQVRVTLRGRDGKLVSYPLSSSQEDQQGFPVLVREVRVLQATPTPVPMSTPRPMPTATPTTTPAAPGQTGATGPAAPAAGTPSQVTSKDLSPEVPTSGSSSSLIILLALVVVAGAVAAATVFATRRPAPAARPLTPYPQAPPSPGSAPPGGVPPGPLKPVGTAPASGDIPLGYEIVGQPKRGGMASVYKAYQRSLARYVALKVLARNLAGDPTFVQRFYAEAQRTAKLEHPNIVTIYDVGQTPNGSFFIAMRHIDGQSLQDLLEREKPVPLPRAVNIAAQVAAALDYAHSQGIIHRDVKPANIMVETGDRVTLTDFGIAVAIGGTRLTQTGAVIGTPEYLSPEQAKGEPVDHRSDVYALGIVFYEMITGRTPFQADTPLAVVHGHVYVNPPSPEEINSQIRSDVGAIVMKALAKERNQRYRTCGEFIDVLRRAI